MNIYAEIFKAFISLQNLINMKKKTNRQKDMEDVKALLELKNL